MNINNYMQYKVCKSKTLLLEVDLPSNKDKNRSILLLQILHLMTETFGQMLVVVKSISRLKIIRSRHELNQ